LAYKSSPSRSNISALCVPTGPLAISSLSRVMEGRRFSIRACARLLSVADSLKST